MAGRRFKYDVCLSFAGEDRDYVRRVAGALKAHGLNIFFDEDKEAELWGADLFDLLDRVYRLESRRCVMFISAAYASKMWTRHERQSAQARALAGRATYLLPARFDDSELPGLRPTIGYIDLRTRTPESFALAVLDHLRPSRLRPRLVVTRKQLAPWVQRGHMFVNVMVGGRMAGQVRSDGWTHRIGLHNPSTVAVEGVRVRLVAVKPEPRAHVVPVTLRKMHDNQAPFLESRGFTVRGGATEFVDVVMLSVHIGELEVQHIEPGVTNLLLPPVSRVQLSVESSNARAIMPWLSIRLTLLSTVDMTLELRRTRRSRAATPPIPTSGAGSISS